MVRRSFAGLIAAVGWFAIIGQFTQTPSAGNYFSFFTILSNILVAVTVTAAALAPESRLGRFLSDPRVATATVLYISVTGLVYAVILAKLYHLEGWVLLFNRLLHYVVPPLFVLFWLAFVRKGTLTIRYLPLMLIAPLAYGAYTLIRGPMVGWYPYPFIDAATLGYPATIRNIVEFTVFFALLGSVYILIDHVVGRLLPRRAAAA